jgi:polyphosphate kinase 2 (PPK2 family)
VHDLVKYQKIPDKFNNKKIWKQRYRQINDFEKYLYENGIVIIKFFLHVSKEEQKERFLKRIDDPAKNWKFSMGDIEERKYWDDYQKAYQEAITATSKRHAPWYVIPADRKWFMRLAVSEILVKEMKKLKPDFPKLDEEQLGELKETRKILMGDSELKSNDQ